MSQEKHDTAPAVASAGITPTQGDQGVTEVIDSSLRISGPANNAKELAEHTGVLNRLDDYFYTHFIRFTSFSWTTSQLTGHVLYSLPLTPYNLSSPLAYIMALYNQWAGGFQIRIEVAGTGFNGGKLMFVRFPPNVDPDNYDINSATVFPYIMLDPKSQVSGVLDIEDYRQGLFHWNQRFSDPYARIQNTIGTFRVFVMLPLISSSLTTASISLQLSSRLSPSFVVSQLIPPQLSEAPTPIEDYEEVFAGYSDRLTLCQNIVLRQMVFVASPTTTLATELCAGFGVTEVSTPVFATQAQTVNGPKVNLSLTQTGLAHQGNNWTEWPNPVCNYWTKTVTANGQTATLYSVAYGNYTTAVEPAPANERTRITAPNGESLVLFTAANGPWGVPTFDALRAATENGLFRGLQDGESIVFQVLDRGNGTPIAYIRLSPGGFFSTNTVTTLVHINLLDVRFKFYSKLPVTTSLPATPSGLWNYAQSVAYSRLIERIAALGDPNPVSDRDSSSQMP